MNKDQFNLTLKLTTAAGSLPLLIFLFLPVMWWAQFQMLAITYVAIVLSFIAGITWLSGCLRKNGKMVTWAVALSLITWLLLFYTWISTTYLVIWVITLLLVNFTWLMDLFFYRDSKEILGFRLVGTISLNLSILAIIIRLAFL